LVLTKEETEGREGANGKKENFFTEEKRSTHREKKGASRLCVRKKITPSTSQKKKKSQKCHPQQEKNPKKREK